MESRNNLNLKVIRSGEIPTPLDMKMCESFKERDRVRKEIIAQDLLSKSIYQGARPKSSIPFQRGRTGSQYFNSGSNLNNEKSNMLDYYNMKYENISK